jgi:hypothetical protein
MISTGFPAPASITVPPPAVIPPVPAEVVKVRQRIRADRPAQVAGTEKAFVLEMKSWKLPQLAR